MSRIEKALQGLETKKVRQTYNGRHGTVHITITSALHRNPAGLVIHERELFRELECEDMGKDLEREVTVALITNNYQRAAELLDGEDLTGSGPRDILSVTEENHEQPE